MNELLERFKKAVEGLAQPVERIEDSRQEMTTEQFIEYATEQLEKAATDTPEIRVERLKALRMNVELFKAEYSFEGPTTSNKFSGVLAVSMFRDPAQVQTTEKTQPPKSVSGGATAFSNVDVQPSVNGAGNVTGDKMPPLIAAGSGFETPTSATFAKALDELGNVLASLAGEEEPEKVETEKADTEEKPEEGEKVKTEKVEAENIESSNDAYWPFDMNTPFGRGETTDPETPEWGIDGQKVPEEVPSEA